MKKILLGTTAVIALGAMSSEAFAADKIKLELGGFMRHYVGLTNSDEVASTRSDTSRDKDISQWSNTEIYFTGNTTLDNGIKVAARVEMEADGAVSKNVDRSWLTISSDAMGALSIGHHPHFGDDNMVRVPNAGNFDWGDTDPWAGVATSATAPTAAFATVAPDISDAGGDSAKLKYTSPNFSGITVGFSYSAAEAADASNARRVQGNTAQDGSTLGIAYSGDLGGAAVSADLTRMNFGANDQDVTHFGLNVGMAGFTVGGGYSDFNDTRTGSNLADGDAWELGVSYATGPYSVSAGYMSAKDKGTAAAGSDKDTKWNIAATYDMGAGVALAANYFHAKADPEGTGTTIATGKSTSISGLIAGIEVGF
ncbi:porin [Magnetovibrio sp.]|uniref:porin n=1 Tax=Magnetovibrio sp. TaxID=2024836 RepID=UPI002F929B28